MLIWSGSPTVGGASRVGKSGYLGIRENKLLGSCKSPGHVRTAESSSLSTWKIADKTTQPLPAAPGKQVPNCCVKSDAVPWEMLVPNDYTSQSCSRSAWPKQKFQQSWGTRHCHRRS